MFLAAKEALYLGLSLTDGGGEEPFRAEAISTCEDTSSISSRVRPLDIYMGQFHHWRRSEARNV